MRVYIVREVHESTIGTRTYSTMDVFADLHAAKEIVRQYATLAHKVPPLSVEEQANDFRVDVTDSTFTIFVYTQATSSYGTGISWEILAHDVNENPSIRDYV